MTMDSPQPVTPDAADNTIPAPRKAKNVKLDSRTIARLHAVQTLYLGAVKQLDLRAAAEEFQASLTAQVPENNSKTRARTADIIKVIIPRQDDIKTIIAEHRQDDWPEHRLNPVITAILTAGIGELMGMPETDTGIIINEYLNIAHGFFVENEPSYIHKVLDLVAAKVRVS